MPQETIPVNKRAKNQMIDLTEIISLLEPEEMLSESQKVALQAVKDGHNVFITGGAGTGKSFLIQVIKDYLEKMNISYRVTASTGAAAYNIGGTTLHAFAGIGLGEDGIDWTIKQLNKYEDKVLRWKSTRVLIIDEVSMIDPAYFEKTNQVAKIIRKTPRQAFGGIQVILVGDFLQLPPVPNKKKVLTDKRRYVFETDAWKELGLKMLKLTTNFRQQKDETFRTLLHSVRVGKLSNEESRLLESRDISRLTGSNAVPDKEMTKLFSYRNDVQRVNTQELAKINSPSQTYKAEIYLCDALLEKQQQQQQSNNKPVSPLAYPVDESIELKVGCSVLLCVNLDAESDLYNGCRGTVIELTKPCNPQEPLGARKQSYPVVEFYNGEKRTIMPFSWTQFDGKLLLSSFTQIPLALAYSVTIHKSQGLTLNKAQVSMKFFESGQAYTSLSRVRDLKDLYLTNFISNLSVKSQIMADPLVIQFYEDNHLF